MHALLLGMSGETIAAWIAASAAILSTVVGIVSSIILDHNNKTFLKEQAEKEIQDRKEHDALLVRLERYFALQDATAANAQAELSLFAHYAVPLLNSIKNVRYRLDEIINTDGVIRYFEHDRPTSVFIEHKRISTYYRFGVLFAWIRAFKIEQTLLTMNAARSVFDQISKVEGAFADGHFVDENRVALFVGNEVREEARQELRHKLSALLQKVLAENEQMRPHQIVSLASEKQKLVCDEIVDLLNEATDTKRQPPDASQYRTLLKRLGVRECWIYRDWQDAMGKVVLEETERSPRRFNVVDYGKFEQSYKNEVLCEPDESCDSLFRIWIGRLCELFDDLDMNNKADARKFQLERVLSEVENLESMLSDKIADFEQKGNLTNGS